ncbi:MAG: response regulator, partial [Proteobacteria bacterium]|nr:response regulator [Pseudomonadota bacterium]
MPWRKEGLAVASYGQQQAEGTPVDMVIVDLTVPAGMGGLETAKQFLELDPEAKIVLASGYSNDPIMANYRGFGFKGTV